MAGPVWNLESVSALTVATLPNLEIAEYSLDVRGCFLPPETQKGVEVLFMKVALGIDANVGSLILVAWFQS
jgi:hypothetical protein